MTVLETQLLKGLYIVLDMLKEKGVTLDWVWSEVLRKCRWLHHPLLTAMELVAETRHITSGTKARSVGLLASLEAALKDMVDYHSMRILSRIQ
jgi:hypothetical protein